MPWKRPSSQPTSWAWAIRSSASLGSSSRKGRAIRSSSATSSGASPSLSSSMERWWMSARRRRPAASSGALRTSSSSCLIIEPMRMTLAGSSTSSAGLVGSRSSRSRRSPEPSEASPAGVAETPMPSGVTTTTRCSSPVVEPVVVGSSLMRSILPHGDGVGPARPPSVRADPRVTGLGMRVRSRRCRSVAVRCVWTTRRTSTPPVSPVMRGKAYRVSGVRRKGGQRAPAVANQGWCRSW